MTQLRTVRARAHGKINAFLHVGDLREDGYHELINVFQALSVAETVTLTPAEANSVEVTGKYASADIPLDDSNLALAAVLALGRATDTQVPVHVHIDKNVPVAGGMGGGSADAAAALRAYAALIGCEDVDLLHEVAASLGADVPFAYTGGTAVGTGRGDDLNPVLTRSRFHWVLATSTGSLSTPAVYRRLDELRAEGKAPGKSDPAEVLRALGSGDAADLAAAVHNDMTEAAIDLLPDVGHVMDTGLQAGALTALVSGSGPTVGFLAENATHALEIAVLLEASRGVRHVVRATGPAHGAELLEG